MTGDVWSSCSKPVTVAGAADEVSVSFAGVSAQAFSIESIVGNLMTLRITPPVYTLSGTDDGFAAAYMTFSASMKKTIQTPRQTGRMRVGCCMQRKRWEGEVVRTRNGTV